MQKNKEILIHHRTYTGSDLFFHVFDYKSVLNALMNISVCDLYHVQVQQYINILNITSLLVTVWSSHKWKRLVQERQ